MGRGKRGVVVPAATVVAAACVAAFVFYATTRRPAIQPEAGPSPPPIRTVVLITIDTLRADRVGAYGWTAARTPAIDALAARGVRFARAFATAPITLPSHASLLTGLYPPGHGSRHNGMKVSAGSATLAMVLREQGWATGAFVGAFPLDRRFGLDRGFDQYGDRMPRGPDGRLLNERPGSQVVDEALAWIGGIGDQPALLWVHLFEPHAPYDAEPARGTGGRDLPASIRYDDEVARADVELGRLLAGLGERAASALVIVAGDHGEAFGEHGEIAHSVFLYDTTLRVPLIIAGPGFARRIARRRRVARGRAADRRGRAGPAAARRGRRQPAAARERSHPPATRPLRRDVRAAVRFRLELAAQRPVGAVEVHSRHQGRNSTTSHPTRPRRRTPSCATDRARAIWPRVSRSTPARNPRSRPARPRPSTPNRGGGWARWATWPRALQASPAAAPTRRIAVSLLRG